MAMYFRYAGGDGKLIPWADINFEDGGKNTGDIPIIENVRVTIEDLFRSESSYEDWFDREGCGEIVDISKWNGDINWQRMWNQTNGVIGRLGYGQIMDQRFMDNIVPGFQFANSEGKYKAVYHYMNTGVSVSNQIDLVLRALDALGENVHAFWSDVEHSYNDAHSPQFRQFPELIMRAVRSERPELKVGFYTNYQGYIDMGLPKELLEEFLLWYAWYPFNHELRYPKPPKGLELKDIYLWQYWADGNQMGSHYGCTSRDIDVNVSRDQKAEFLYENLHSYNEGEIIVTNEEKLAQLKNEQALLMASTLSHSDQMIEIAMGLEVQPEVLYEVQVIASQLNVRSGPDVTYDKIGQMLWGNIVEIFEEVAGDGRNWGKISSSEEEWVALDYTEKI